MSATATDTAQRALAWIAGPHVGASSKSIWCTMQGVKEPRGASFPYDPDDFFRCRRLLQLIPEWRERMPEMAQHGPVWATMAARWDEIDALFMEETQGRWERGIGASAPRTYALMRQIIGRR